MKSRTLGLLIGSFLFMSLAQDAECQALDVAYATDGRAYALMYSPLGPDKDVTRSIAWNYGLVAGVEVGGAPAAGFGAWVQTRRDSPVGLRLGGALLTSLRKPVGVLTISLGARL